jgi:hypothetical protein
LITTSNVVWWNKNLKTRFTGRSKRNIPIFKNEPLGKKRVLLEVITGNPFRDQDYELKERVIPCP